MAKDVIENGTHERGRVEADSFHGRHTLIKAGTLTYDLAKMAIGAEIYKTLDSRSRFSTLRQRVQKTGEHAVLRNARFECALLVGENTRNQHDTICLARIRRVS